MPQPDPPDNRPPETTAWEGEDAVSPAPESGRYQDIQRLGLGGMAEVRRVYDRQLRRTVAMKVIHAGSSDARRARFEAEAALAARMQHPVCVPVYDVGVREDGRPYYTMREVEARRLHEAIHAVHTVSSPAGWRATADGLSLRTLVRALEQVCRAVAYAHDLGVLHLDIKPANIQLGRFEEVQLLDWGVAWLLGSPPSDSPGSPGSGTVGYMPREQALRDAEHLSPACDVYALGITLLHVLTNQVPPRELTTGAESAANLLARASRSTPPLPEPLVEACHRATRERPADRLGSAAELGDLLKAWLDGLARRENAMRTVAEADALRDELAMRRTEAERLRVEAADLLAKVPAFAPLARSRRGWRREDEASGELDRANHVEATIERKLASAIELDPDNREARERLGQHYRTRLAEAEEVGDRPAVARFAVLLQAYDPRRWEEWVRAEATLSLTTNPPGAIVRLYQYREVDRQLVPEFKGVLGTTPLERVVVPAGSLLLEVEAPGRPIVRYPVLLRRGEHHEPLRPGETSAQILRVPAASELGPDDIFVPAGWFIAGDPLAADGLPRTRVWADDFVIRRFPVTNGEYLEFLNDLAARGRMRDAERWAPRDGGGHNQRSVGFIAAGDRWGPGELMSLSHPVSFVDASSAAAFCVFERRRSSRRWRLPHEQEWEKAARGVDGRRFPWGDTWVATLANTGGARRGTPTVGPADDFPADQSVYRVRGLAGNVRDWCRNGWRSPHLDRVCAGPSAGNGPTSGAAVLSVRGGAFMASGPFCATAARFGARREKSFSLVGFRLARTLRADDLPST